MTDDVQNVPIEPTAPLHKPIDLNGALSSKQRWTLRDYLFSLDDGLTIEEVKFADAYTKNPSDIVSCAMEAGQDEQFAKAWASFVIRKPQVKQRIQDNLALARRSSVMSVRERLEILTQIGRSTIADCVTIQNGRMEIDIEKAKKHGSDRGIISIKIDDKSDETGGSSRSRSIGMANPIQAIKELNEMEGLYNKKLSKSGAVVLIPVEDLRL